MARPTSWAGGPGWWAGPDVREVVRHVRATPGRGEAKIRRVAAGAGLIESQVRLAVDYYRRLPGGD